VVAEAVSAGRIPELAGYAELRRDAIRNRGCRLDLVVRGNGLRPCHMKIESVTLAQNGTALFPDTTVAGAAELMHELTNLVREGNRVMIMFLAQRADVESFSIADHLDPEYAQAFRDALARGVETACYRSKITRRGIELDKRLPVILEEA